MYSRERWKDVIFPGHQQGFKNANGNGPLKYAHHKGDLRWRQSGKPENLPPKPSDTPSFNSDAGYQLGRAGRWHSELSGLPPHTSQTSWR